MSNPFRAGNGKRRDYTKEIMLKSLGKNPEPDHDEDEENSE